MALCVDAERVARNHHDLVGERPGDLVYDAFQHSKAQSEDDGIGVTQRIVVVHGDDRRATDLCGQPPRRLSVGAREPQGLAA